MELRPVLVVVAGPNGAGKTTFYHAHLQASGLRLLNADVVAREVGLDAPAAARVVNALREELVRQRESFVLETVFSDPVGDKLAFMKRTVASGYDVILCFIGLANPRTSERRVAMRVSQGGHDVPSEKLAARYPRTLANLRSAIGELPAVRIYDNEDLRTPFRAVATLEHGRLVRVQPPVPSWLRPLLPGA